ncbi:hypothetical protein LCGC14_1915050 [marine sediment metagenome]|uniref:AP2/ERF domain-containing protein n=1 Tax=marine sediment metagenome TaxID=412755 RepID=A0A0F9IQG0_9ZZZZ
MLSKIDITGLRYGRLVVLKENRRIKDEPLKWLCQCDCGNTVSLRAIDLKSQNTQSCGCFRRETTSKTFMTHGNTKNYTNTPEYAAWKRAKKRCYNRNDKSYKYYGGRGITMCKEWLNSFEQFLKDMGKRPDGLTLERVNNDGNYEASNCKWAIWKEQRNNRRD